MKKETRIRIYLDEKEFTELMEEALIKKYNLEEADEFLVGIDEKGRDKWVPFVGVEFDLIYEDDDDDEDDETIDADPDPEEGNELPNDPTEIDTVEQLEKQLQLSAS